jgi:hypothetical protein
MELCPYRNKEFRTSMQRPRMHPGRTKQNSEPLFGKDMLRSIFAASTASLKRGFRIPFDGPTISVSLGVDDTTAYRPAGV